MLVPIQNELEFIDFVLNGNERQCFGMVWIKENIYYGVEYHGCGNEPEVVDVFEYNPNQLIS